MTKYAIRIHTMLGRVKVYHAKFHSVANNELVIVGSNSESNVEGEFHYPLVNIEHYNIIHEKHLD